MESWHIKKNGAVLTDIPTIARARPGHNPEDVVILDYTARLTEYRRDLSNLAPLISAGKIPISLK
jgi:hypothetical protein